jgi:cytochrome c556
MKIWIKSTLAAGLTFAVLGAGVTTTQPAFADGAKGTQQLAAHHGKKMKKKMGAVTARRAAMKAISKANKAMKAAAKANNAQLVIQASNIIIKQASRLPKMFPKGTSRAKLGKKATRSKAAIWKNWKKFIAANNKMKAAAVKVAAAAGAGNAKAGAKGIGKTCGGCHKPFRGKKAKKKKS